MQLCAGTFLAPAGGLNITANNLTVEGEGPATSIVDGTGVANGNSVFGVLLNANFRKLTVRNHTRDDGPGAGIEAYGGGLVTVSDSVFSNLKVTRSGSGGAIYSGKAVIDSSEFSGNSAEYRGGAVFTSSSSADSLSISNSRLADNRVLLDPASGYREGYGGAIWSAGRVDLNDSTLESNSISVSRPGVTGTARARGGAVFATWIEMTGSTLAGNSITLVQPGDGEAFGAGAYVSDTFNATESLIEGNLAKVTGSSYPEPWGGGVAGQGTSVATLTDTTLSNNAIVVKDPSTISSNPQGGGMRMGRGVTLVRSTVSGNQSARYGGGMWVENLAAGPTYVIARNSTFSGNQATNGSAIFAYASSGPNSTVTLENVTVAGNSASEAAGVAVWSYGGSLKATNSIVSDARGCDWDPGFSPALGDGGNVISDPSGSCDAFGTAPLGKTATAAELELGPLADNGGPTRTMALGNASGAIGAAVASQCPATDQRGVARPSSACDAGAYQYVAPPPGPGPTPEPGPRPGPEPGPGPGPGPTPEPSNRFTFPAPKSRGSTIAVTVSVPGPGKVRVVARRAATAAAMPVACRSSRTATAAGRLKLLCRANSAARARQRRGPVRLRVSVTFAPTGGTARTKYRSAVLRQIRPAFTG